MRFLIDLFRSTLSKISLARRVVLLGLENQALKERLSELATDGHGLEHLQRALQVCNKSTGGIFKRIDENRELLEFLKENAPDLLERSIWIEGWIEGQDHFLNDLVHALNIANPLPMSWNVYPRPWTGRKQR